VGLGLLYEVLRSHSDTPHSVALLWTSDRPIAETSTCRDPHSLVCKVYWGFFLDLKWPRRESTQPHQISAEFENEWNITFTPTNILTACTGIALLFFPMARQPLGGLGRLIFSRLHDHTLFRHTTLGRTPLDEWAARRRDLYLTTNNNHKRQTSMP
jgi:hypothetical protein